MGLEHFDEMKVIGDLTTLCLKELKSLIKPGISTQAINEFVYSFQRTHGLKNSQRNYMGFPAYCCTSVNDVVCHGIPSKKVILKSGDIIAVDVTFNLNGWHGDSCWTYPVGKVDEKTNKLIDMAKQAVKIGIEQVKLDKPLWGIGNAIEEYLSQNKGHVFKEFCGHSIGKYMHMDPQILHHKHRSFLKVKKGMMFTIEPIVTFGSTENTLGQDGWTVYAKDKKKTAQFEVTLGVDENGPVIFTPIFETMDS